MLKQHKSSGFTFTELLVALTINAILLTTLISIFVTNIGHYRKVVNSNRLNQQLQSAMYLMSSDIRRAGYWGNASSDIGTAQNNNPFMAAGTDIAVTGGSCILFTYDKNSDNSLPSINAAIDDERYGFRLNGGALQARPPGASFACNAAATAWENVTDTNLITITSLSFTLNSSTVTTGPGTQGIIVRSVDISVTGQLVSDNTITKTLTQHVRIRNDKFIP